MYFVEKVKNSETFLDLGIDKLDFDVIMISSAWSDGRKLNVRFNLRKVRASQSKVLANGKSRRLEGKCNRK